MRINVRESLGTSLSSKIALPGFIKGKHRRNPGPVGGILYGLKKPFQNLPSGPISALDRGGQSSK